MPTFGHIFYGFCLLIPLLYYTKNRFNYKVAIIFFINNLWGPDLVNLFFITPFHSILGFLILAVPYSLIWTYSSRFSLVKSEKGFPLKFEDTGVREVNWKNSYCLVAAGGISHFFIDQFFHNELEMNLWDSLWFDIKIPHTDILGWTWVPQHTLSPLYLIGDAIAVFTLLLSFYFLRKGYKDTFKLFLISTGLSLFLMLVVSPLVYYGEREFAVMFEIALYIFLPLMLLLYVGKNVEEHPRENPDVPKIKRETALKVVSLISICFAVFMLLYALIALLMADLVASLYGGSTSEDILSITIMGFYYLVIATALLVGSIGVIFKVNICRYLAIAAASYFIVFGFPIAIAFFLCESEVKAMFRK
ncbi:MAG: hypothetical protein ACFFD5_10070 [Candidatus Thorarchaeota archaeon]